MLLRSHRKSRSPEIHQDAPTIANVTPPSPDPNAPQLFPPGHYYSPIVNIQEIEQRHDEIFVSPSTLPGIDLRSDAQLSLAPVLGALCKDAPYRDHPYDNVRYGFVNDFFSFGDGLVLHAMMRHLRPKQYIEIGSGWSSALVLDVLESDPDAKTSCTFIEPYPHRLYELVGDRLDQSRTPVEIIEKPLSGVNADLFATLTAGDVLFIDSTHVSRAGSDVNNLFFDVLPTLPSGVHIHIHDVFYPFEYPPEWVYEGRNWTEDYLLRAYLINNPKIQINWFNSYLSQHHKEFVSSLLPGWENNPGGSIWLETLA